MVLKHTLTANSGILFAVAAVCVLGFFAVSNKECVCPASSQFQGLERVVRELKELKEHVQPADEEGDVGTVDVIPDAIKVGGMPQRLSHESHHEDVQDTDGEPNASVEVDAEHPAVKGGTKGSQCEIKPSAAADAYLDLLHRSLRKYTYAGPQSLEDSSGGVVPVDGFETWVPHGYREGAYTLLCHSCIQLLQRVLEHVVDTGVPGGFMEAGVFRGGASMYMQAFLVAHDIDGVECSRPVVLADSFKGIPPPRTRQQDQKWTGSHAAGLDMVKSNFWRYNLYRPNLQFIQGYFNDSLPSADIPTLSVLRSDVDTFDSTIDVLTYAYPKLEPGGIFLIDDWHLLGCRQAIAEFRDKHGITDTIYAVKGLLMGKVVLKNAYWKKGSGPDQSVDDCLLVNHESQIDTGHDETRTSPSTYKHSAACVDVSVCACV
eukprot:m.1269217 g.1269217  ORF g.1269217 m.1269217 type:complete len:431 (+) comp24746_c0_seq39:134-1426(+)